MSFMNPLWTICTYMRTCFGMVSDADYLQLRSSIKPRTISNSAGCLYSSEALSDSAVHINEEASNADIPVP